MGGASPACLSLTVAPSASLKRSAMVRGLRPSSCTSPSPTPPRGRCPSSASPTPCTAEVIAAATATPSTEEEDDKEKTTNRPIITQSLMEQKIPYTFGIEIINNRIG